MIDQDFYTLLSSIDGVDTQQNSISEDKPATRVFFQRSNSNVDLFLNGSVFSVETIYTVEVASLDIDVGGALAESIKSTLNGYRGTVGSTTFLACFVIDASDDYIQKAEGSDEGYHSFAFSVRCLT